MNSLPAILRFGRKPVERIWGGQYLQSWLGGQGAGAGPVGESWEIFDRGPQDSSELLEPVAGCRSLHELMERHAEALLGRASADAEGRFPLMLKLLDAQDRLSLQVHPDDDLARDLGTGDSGKDEAWVVLRAEPGAWLVRGLAPGHGIQELFEVLEAGGDPEPLLLRLPSHRGDVVDIPAGTLHCIGPGNLLYEIQKNSDLTWRLSDWGRLGQDGRPRELHLAPGRRALESATQPVTRDPEADRSPKSGDGTSRDPGLLVDCSAFFLRRLLADRVSERETGHLPQILTAVRGSARIRCGSEETLLKEGDTCLVRGGVASYDVHPESVSRNTDNTDRVQCELLLATPADR